MSTSSPISRMARHVPHPELQTLQHTAEQAPGEGFTSWRLPGGNQSSQGGIQSRNPRTISQHVFSAVPRQLPVARKGGETAALLSYLLLCFSINTFKCQLFLPYTETDSDCDITPLTTESMFFLSLTRAL